MHEVMQPTQDTGWVLTHEGYSVLTESAVESRFALANGFLGVRAARSISRGPTWMSWLGYIKWAPLPAAPRSPAGAAPGSPALWGHASRSEGVRVAG
jgi:hypothetical protein